MCLQLCISRVALAWVAGIRHFPAVIDRFPCKPRWFCKRAASVWWSTESHAFHKPLIIIIIFRSPLFSDNFFNSWSTFSWADYGCYPLCYFHSLFNLHNVVTQTSQGGLLAGQPWFWLLLWLPHRGTDLLHPHVRTSSLKLIREADQNDALIDKVQKMSVYGGQSCKHEFREKTGCVCEVISFRTSCEMKAFLLFHA